MLARSFSQRSFLTLLFVFCLIAIIVSLRSFSQDPSQQHQPLQPNPPTSAPFNEPVIPDNHCSDSSTPADTVVIVKTGANEIYDKLPTQLLTALRCYKDLLFFSDLAQQLGPYTILDALDNVTQSVKTENPEFDYYRTLREYQKNGQDIGTLRKTFGDAAWNLDKYKFLHMLEKTWKLRPNRKWYIYIEADTYLVRSNLRLWLQRLDPSQPLYLGSPTYVNGEAFSHGGSGFILSGTALSKFAEGDEGIAARYDSLVQYEKFGDYILMKALKEKGVRFSSVWPLLQAEKPSTLPFGPGPDNGVRHWCQPIVTMHHINPDEASRIWAFEQKMLDSTNPLLLKDLYAGMVASEIPTEREDWYNLSDDLIYRAPGVSGDRQKPSEDMSAIEKEAYMSFEHCRRACEEHNRCYQFVYSEQLCGFSFSYRLGRRRLPESSGTSYKSGWLLDDIARDQAAHPCSTPEWI